MKLCINTQTIQELGCIGLSFPSVHFCKFTFQFAGADSGII